MRAAELRALAPEPFASWDTVVASLDAATTPGRRAAVGALVASVLRTEPPEPDSAPDALDPAVAAFAEQVVLDVGSLTDGQRAAALADLGAEGFGFVQLLYVTDLGTRMAAAWRQLFGTELGIDDPAAGVELWPALDAFMTAVARRHALDPLTTELVRLRGARAHRCRLCQSLRNVRAANAGADEATYDEIDRHETSTVLSERQRVALRIVDAILWTPAAYPDGLAASARHTFSDAEVVEIVLDVARNAANKIAVALGADEANVAEGLEYYDVDERGELVYGLTPAR
jgi:alkylhydroperoxidase family enzyme